MTRHSKPSQLNCTTDHLANKTKQSQHALLPEVTLLLILFNHPFCFPVPCIKYNSTELKLPQDILYYLIIILEQIVLYKKTQMCNKEGVKFNIETNQNSWTKLTAVIYKNVIKLVKYVFTMRAKQLKHLASESCVHWLESPKRQWRTCALAWKYIIPV